MLWCFRLPAVDCLLVPSFRRQEFRRCHGHLLHQRFQQMHLLSCSSCLQINEMRSSTSSFRVSGSRCNLGPRVHPPQAPAPHRATHPRSSPLPGLEKLSGSCNHSTGTFRSTTAACVLFPATLSTPPRPRSQARGARAHSQVSRAIPA